MIKKEISKALLFFLLMLVNIIIGLVDYITGPEFSFSIFYTLIIAALSLYKHSKPSDILFASVFSSIIWLIVELVSRHYSNLFFPIWNAFVRFSMFASIGILIYYLKVNHDKLKQTNEQLNSLNEEKNELIGIAAHDLRNPIGAIHSLSDIILNSHKQKLNYEVIEMVIFIHSVSGQTLALLDELLDVSKIENGNFNLKFEIYDFIEFIKKHISINEFIAHNKSIGIQFNTNLTSYIVHFDKNYLGEVIDNLLSNAIKYSPPNTNIEVKITLPDGLNILTEVIDQGIGIKEDEQQSLFNYFQTTSTKPTAGEKSTGLGLAIAKKIIQLHNGKIGLKSSFGKGSTFYFTLPLMSHQIVK